MFTFRAMKAYDREKIISLAFLASEGLSSMPKDRQVLNDRMDISLCTWANARAVKEHDRFFLFVLEGLGARILGFSGIRSNVAPGHVALEVVDGDQLSWTSIRPSCSELCALFLDSPRRHGGMGKALSFGRFLYIRHHRHLFGERLLAQLRGHILPSGECPFWSDLARHSGNRLAKHLDFVTAHHLVATGVYNIRDLICEPLPRLSQMQSHVYHHVHEQSQGAEHLLKQLGFHQSTTLDPLDGGIHYEAWMDEISIFRYLQCLRLVTPFDGIPELLMVTKLNNPEFEIYIVNGCLDEKKGVVCLEDEATKHLTCGTLLEVLRLG